MNAPLKRREGDKRLIRFDLTINLPLVVTLIIGFSSLVATVLKGYYEHDTRIRAVEQAQIAIEKGRVVETQGIILERIDALTRSQIENSQRFSRLEDKLDRVIEGRTHK